MISQFWNGTRNGGLRAAGATLGATLGTPLLVALLALLPATGAWAQKATRTQLATARDAGVTVLTATVSDMAGNPVADGSVSFETARGSLGSAFVKSGAASLAAGLLPPSLDTVTAVYHPGNTALGGSSSAAAQLAPQVSTVPGFTVTASPTSVSVAPGDFANIVLTVTSQNGFAQPVTLSCSNAPGDVTCGFNPITLTPPANGSVTSALQLTTEAPSGITQNRRLKNGSPASGLVYAAAFPGALLLAGLFAARRRGARHWRVLGCFAILAAGTLLLSGCGQRYYYLNFPPSGNYGTAAGTYSIIISAYSTNGTGIINAPNVTVALTVQ